MRPPEASRLTPTREQTIAPFVRAESLEDISLYWLPVSRFPMRPDQGEWINDFQTRLAAHLRTTQDLREEVFLRFKAIYPDLDDTFIKTSAEFRPIVGGGIAPGESLPPAADFISVKTEVENATKQGTPVDVYRWMPDLTYWFARKKAPAQRKHFLGHGGLTTVFLPPSKDVSPPPIKLPRFVKTAPGFDRFGETKMQEEIDFAYSLRDPFLQKSKEMFGDPYRADPGYGGLLFVLPLFTAASLLGATADQREAWFTLFGAYLTESTTDNGIFLATKEPDFNPELFAILDAMHEDGRRYRD